MRLAGTLCSGIEAERVARFELLESLILLAMHNKSSSHRK